MAQMKDLSILIPARNEMFLLRTIQDILEHAHSDFEIVVVLDGQWAPEPIPDHPQVHLIHHGRSIGQRAACNEAARLSSGRYLMKVDAHCSYADGFDTVLLQDIQEDWTLVPVMKNLHAFDWVCPHGHRRYQGPSGPCRDCGEPTTMDVVWFAKPSPNSTAYCFDPEPHFQYFRGYAKRPEAQSEISETMSLQGSCFMISRERYFDLNICDESLGSWGSQGIEVACKSWLSGGRVLCDKKTWYAHMFRTQGADFGFPYSLPQSQVEYAKKGVHELFFEGKWDKMVRLLSWLVERFWPVQGWTDLDLERLKVCERESSTIRITV